MLTSFKILRDHLLRRIPEKWADTRFEPPVGKMLVATLMLYGALCAYGFSQL